MNLDRRSLFGVVAGAVAGACLPSAPARISTEWNPVINDDLFDVANNLPEDFSKWKIVYAPPICVTCIDGVTYVDFGIGKNATFDMAENAP